MFIVTEVQDTFSIYSATNKQSAQFMTDPKQAIKGRCWAINTVQDVAEEMTVKEQIGLFNQLNDSQLVKFPSKAAGAQRIFPLLKEHASTFQPAKAKKKPQQVVGVITLPVDECLYTCRDRSKQAALVDSLKNGATMAQLVEACSAKNGGKDWTESSVKSGIYWDINKLKGYGVRTETDEKGVHRYFLVYPEGRDAPLPHTPLRKPVVTT